MVSFTYLYRDASNYKAHEDMLLKGELTPELEARLRGALIDDEYFIPEKVGVPSLRERLYQYSDGASTDDDHLLHEVLEIRAATPEEASAGAALMSVEELVRRFEAVSAQGWWTGASHLLDELGLTEEDQEDIAAARAALADPAARISWDTLKRRLRL
ncbi:MAG: hypothetical protein ABR551_04270 [Gemmatimonadales bacterium]